MLAKSGIFKGLNPTITVVSKILVILFVTYCALQAEQAGLAFEKASTALLQNFKWLYILLMTSVVSFLFFTMFSRFGHIRLGKDDERPEFSFVTWISMLFSGGMGVGLVFWSAAEPIHHYMSNPFTANLTDEAASMSMQLTFFHWGLHPWAIFCITALALAYFSYRKGLPFSLRSMLYPFIGDRIYGPIGHVVDIFTVIVTAFGIAQSLGMSALQINTGLNRVFGIENSITVQLSLLAVLCSIATYSAVTGVKRGMKYLSNLNMILAALIILVVLSIGPTRYIINTLLESTGNYTQNIIGMSLWSDAQKDTGWQNWWTAYYWPWWMTWAPFVGMFVARISKGRTIRELIGGVLLVPTLLTFVWMSVIGGSALKVEQNARHAYEAQTTEMVGAGQSTVSAQAAEVVTAGQPAAEAFAGGPIVEAVKQDATFALFTMFDNIGGSFISPFLSILACILLCTFLITSADSGTYVLCFLDAEGHQTSPKKLRVVWGAMIAVIAGAVLYAGGLQAMQTASIIAGFPISIFLLIMCVTLFKSLNKEADRLAAEKENLLTSRITPQKTVQKLSDD